MLTTVAYAEQLAAGDTGWWRCAVRQAAGWISAQHPTIDLDRLVPLPQLMVQATALVVYGLARSRAADPVSIAAEEVLEWVAQRQLPLPPEPDGPDSAAERVVAIRLWRHEVDDAAERQQRDLAALLRAAGHAVPAVGHRGLGRSSPDPVISTWLALVDTEPPDGNPVRMMDRFPTALLSLGLTGLVDLA